MNHLGLSDASIRRIANKLKISTDCNSNMDSAYSRIIETFTSNHYFGEITKVEPPNRAENTLIFCHGLGGTGTRWKHIVADKLAPHLKSTRFLLPTACKRFLHRDPSTAIRAWYDFDITEGRRTPDLDDLLVSAAYISFLAQQERNRLKLHDDRAKIFLGGFSQGATLALYTLLTNSFPFDGILALSGYSPRFVSFDEKASVNQLHQIPLFIAFGDEDDVLPLSLHNETVNYLHENGVQMYSKMYSGLRHSTCSEELDDIIAFLKKLLGNQSFAPD